MNHSHTQTVSTVTVLFNPDFAEVTSAEVGATKADLMRSLAFLGTLCGWGIETPLSWQRAALRDLTEEGRFHVALTALRSGGVGADDFEAWAAAQDFSWWCLTEETGSEAWVAAMLQGSEVLWFVRTAEGMGAKG